MFVFVNNCFHWVGFHIVSYLLEEGWKVDGRSCSNDKTTDHFHMFLGRNTNFSLVEPDTAQDTYDVAFTVDTSISKISCERHFVLCDKQVKKTAIRNYTKQYTFIQLPTLFGEWMPMTEEGIHTNHAFIPYSSNKFIKEAVYIERFVGSLVQLMHATSLPEQIFIKSRNSKDATEKIEKSIYLYDNMSVEEVERVQKHYTRYYETYQAVLSK
ncbi:hypothetical protein ACLIBH_07705 [Virgibacillus sp. W0430]|uniref:hypothetical protein n=1 Tax=Virgibacillus sp. W0430 TaxID=3391580 RepID=UPI003F480BD1